MLRRSTSALVVVLLIASARQHLRLLIAALLACPLMMLIMFATTRSSATTRRQATSQLRQGFRPTGLMMASYGFVVLLFLVGIVVALARAKVPDQEGPTATPHSKRAARPTLCPREVDDDGISGG